MTSRSVSIGVCARIADVRNPIISLAVGLTIQPPTIFSVRAVGQQFDRTGCFVFTVNRGAGDLMKVDVPGNDIDPGVGRLLPCLACRGDLGRGVDAARYGLIIRARGRTEDRRGGDAALIFSDVRTARSLRRRRRHRRPRRVGTDRRR